MLIDTFAENWLMDLSALADERPSAHGLYLLIDGVFVPGLHRLLDSPFKALLFESLPACSDETKDVSPFLVPFDPACKPLTSLLRTCDRWPMVSAIQTPESLTELNNRLAAWCVVEADGQRFNFRFPDTRRLPTIFHSLSESQRSQMCGPAVRWSYISRDGNWRELLIEGVGANAAENPVLDQPQFAKLVEDSRSDELLTLLCDRGYEIYRRPSRSHALLTIALRAAAVAELDNDDTISWCDRFWHDDQLHDDPKAAAMLTEWRNSPC